LCSFLPETLIQSRRTRSAAPSKHMLVASKPIDGTDSD
jgi:hypothetical protein